MKRCVLFFATIALWMCQLENVLANGNFTSLINRRRRNLFTPFRNFKTVCYEPLGCFPTGPPFYHPMYRPISIPPFPPSLQGTTFYLYTRDNRDAPLVFTPLKLEASLLERHFKASRWTRIIIHAVLDGLKVSTFMKATKDIFLSLADENVILVDHGSKVPPLFIPAANARVIGAQVWLLIDFLQKNFGAMPENFHIIGHSIGAQIAGYAGERLQNLGRITGLDPAGPYFQNVPNNVKLDSSDALFVDIIHTNPGRNILEGVGNVEDVGHVNFWPGGGKPPGCALSPFRALRTGVFPTEFLQNVFFCRHFRAPEFFRFSFHQHGCLFVGAECPSWEEFTLGRCNCGSDGQKCRIMGQYSTPARYETRYHVQVGKERPYCLHQYQVTVYLEVPQPKTYGSIPVMLNIAIDAGKGFQETLRFSMNLMDDVQVKTFLLTFKKPIGKVHSMSTALHYPQSKTDVNISLEAVEINYLFPLPKKDISNLLCKESEKPLQRGKQTVLTPRACKTLPEFQDRSIASVGLNSTYN